MKGDASSRDATAPSEIVLDDVSAGYDGRDVVTGVHATVPAGSWLSIIGPNGAGKSTLLKALVGLVPHGGSIRIDRRVLSGLSHRARARAIGYAPQVPALPGGLSVTDYTLLGRTPHLGLLARESGADVAIVAEVLRRLDLEALADRPLDTLSGGERQRTVLARVLATQTGVLMLDEPTTGLDIGHAQALLELVEGLRVTDGTTVVTTLHDLTLAAQYADQMMLLDGGKVIATGPPGTVLTADRLTAHYSASTQVIRNDNGEIVVAPLRRRRPHGGPSSV